MSKEDEDMVEPLSTAMFSSDVKRDLEEETEERREFAGQGVGYKPELPLVPPSSARVGSGEAADGHAKAEGKVHGKAEGKAKLDDLVGKVKGINLEVIIAVGHTDSVGSDAYNQKLSVKRSDAVKAYLVTKGIEKNRVYTEGKGEKQPVADNKTSAGRSKNRRVEIEVVGTRPNN